jgi:hypothetical protein
MAPKRMKREATDIEKITVNHIYATYLFPEYVKNSQNPVIRN